MRRVRHDLLLCAATLAALGACNDRPLASLPPGASGQGNITFPVAVNRKLDLLFVIDNSQSMADEQASLIRNFERLIRQIESIEHGLPDLHIGVVSTDIGVGFPEYPISSCTESGDGGRLGTRAASCQAVQGSYIVDIAGEGGMREQNYTGTLTDAFGCMAGLGIRGCGFEQPLEAMRLALDGARRGTIPTNAGFLRDDARLAIIFITDEDDCSADPALFDPDTQVLGALSNFRCFEYGITCEEPTRREAGELSGCEPMEESPYLHGIDEYVSFLRGLKAHPDRDILVAAIMGEPADPIVIVSGQAGEIAVAQSCPTTAPNTGDTADTPDTEDSEDTETAQVAYPPLRLQAFLRSFAYAKDTSICNTDLAAPLSEIGAFIGPPPEGACISSMLADIDQEAPGVQPECVVSETRAKFTAQHEERLLPACDNLENPKSSSVLPCYTLLGTDDDDDDDGGDGDDGASECSEPGSLWLQVHYHQGEVVPPDTEVAAHCLAF